MADIVRAAAAAVVVVVVVVALGGGPGGKCGVAHASTNCNSETDDTEVFVSFGEEEVILREAIRQARWSVNKYLYMVPVIGFEGVRAEVTTNMGTFPAWFPIMDHCTLDNSRWWQVLLVVKKHTNSTLTVTLTVQNCLLSCELTTGAKHTSGRDLKLQNLELFGRGGSRWREQHPRYPCRVESEAKDPILVMTPSCTNPPSIGSASSPHSKTEKRPARRPAQGTALSTALSSPRPTPPSPSRPATVQTEGLTPPLRVAAVVVVVIIILMVVFVMMRCQDRQEY
ncbi:uncharacterized protein LOC123514660 isoform X2 [Portunus trituberculatus]|uniref:Uncharacterized protein n=1 Tax=Portunus trituberculatus TaxID=210409 RepID=A0A5B7FC12_PORTR|nr:uncharacterized protein LOC123514660 isoform X2 [Portunus trituberculatus]MPC43097.1 hypothetical protein [Portunus trituberculatus]